MMHRIGFTVLLFTSILMAAPISTSDIPPPQDVPKVEGNFKDGWKTMPNVDNAVSRRNWPLDDSGAVISLYMSAKESKTKIKRVVIVNNGKNRDCWSPWTYAYNGLNVAASESSHVKVDEVLIISPCWFGKPDLEAGAAHKHDLRFPIYGWFTGLDSIGPKAHKGYSSFKVLDALISKFLDQSAYPNVEAVCIAGHSAGGQMVQRFAALRSSTAHEDRLHYWVANPSTFLWLVPDRPDPNPKCTGVDSYKYGLDGNFPPYASEEAVALGRAKLVERYRARNVHYAFGTRDHGTADPSCQADTEGKNRNDRAKNFVKMLHEMEGGFPKAHTLDWVEGVGHTDKEMVQSASAMQWPFKGQPKDAL